MSFKTQLGADALSFLNTDEFAEEITYTPKGGDAKTIRAVVSREQADASPIDRNRVLRNRAEVWIANDATHGITSPGRGDVIDMPIDTNEASATWVVSDILGADEGIFHLLVSR